MTGGEERGSADGWTGIKKKKEGNRRKRGFEDCIERSETTSDRLRGMSIRHSNVNKSGVKGFKPSNSSNFSRNIATRLWMQIYLVSQVREILSWWTIFLLIYYREIERWRTYFQLIRNFEWSNTDTMNDKLLSYGGSWFTELHSVVLEK